MANAAHKVLKSIEENEIEFVDLRFTDPKGKWQHLTMASGMVDEDQLTDGFMLDGSSIAGWKAINESDMILKPDLDAAYVDPFSATPMMILFCNVVEPSTGELYGGSSYPDYLDMRDRNRAFQSLAAYTVAPASLTIGGRLSRGRPNSG